MQRHRSITASRRRRRGPNGPTASPAGAPLLCPLRRRSTRQIGARTASAPTPAPRPQRRVPILAQRVPGWPRPQKITHRARRELDDRRERPPKQLQRHSRESLQPSMMRTRIISLRRSRRRYRHRCDPERRLHTRQRKFLPASTANRLCLMRGRRTLRALAIPTATPVASSNSIRLRHLPTSLQTCPTLTNAEITSQELPPRPGLFRLPITRR